jgi:hypothetical protein
VGNWSVLVLERALATLRELPRLTQAGIAMLLFGLVIDLLAHLGWTSGMAVGHLVTLAGMVVALAGVLALGLSGNAKARQQRR